MQLINGGSGGRIDMLAIHETFTESQRTRSYLANGWIDLNVSIDPTGSQQLSLLHLASKNNNLPLVDFLLKLGADPDVKDANGKKPLDLAKAENVKTRLKNAISMTPIISSSLAKGASSSNSGLFEAPGM